MSDPRPFFHGWRARAHYLTRNRRFLLRTSAGLSFEAAAQELGIPVGTAKTRMRSALLHLRGALAAFAPRDVLRRAES